MSLISVIVPVYKVEPYIHRCVNSILNQTFRDFELILVDDGSPDNCGAICEEYAKADERVHVIHQENGGLSAARNTGIDWAFANSSSQWLTFVDSDDWLHLQMLEWLLKAAEMCKSNIAVCGYAETPGAPVSIAENQWQVEMWAPEAFYTERNTNAVVAWGKLYRKESFRDIRYPVGKIHEDEFTTYKLLFAESVVGYVPAPLYCYFQNQTGITRSAWSPKRLVALDALKEQVCFFKEKGYAAAYETIAIAYCESIRRHLALIADAELPVQDKQRYGKQLKKLLRHAAWQYRDVYMSKKNRWECRWIYTEAVPVIMPAAFFVIENLIKLKLLVRGEET